MINHHGPFIESWLHYIIFRRVCTTARSHERVLEIEGKELSRLLRSDSVDKDANYVLAEVKKSQLRHVKKTCYLGFAQ